MAMVSPVSAGGGHADNTRAKTPRNLSACDACRARKVKCIYSHEDDDGNECRGCRHAGIRCTRDKPRRTRGPGKRQWSQHSPLPAATSPTLSRFSQSSDSRLASTPTRGTTDTIFPPSPFVTDGDGDFHGVCSRSTILTILTDWADQVYPLAPLLHRQTFLHRLLSREDERNPVFCALVLSTCAVTVSTLRRLSFQKYPGVTVMRCVAAIDQAQMLQPRTYTLDWCICCYNVASSLSALDGPQFLRQYETIKDAIAGVQWLLFCEPRREVMALHDREISRRLFWLMTMWQLAAEMRGETFLTFLPSRSLSLDLDSTRPRPLSDSELGVPRPENLDTSMLDTEAKAIWLKDNDQYITGLNSLLDVMMVWEHVKIDMAHRPAADTLQAGMARMQAVMDNLAPELRWRGGLTRFPVPSPGHEAQTLNILITSLYIRSNLLQHLGTVPGISHASIVSDVLGILEHISPDVHEANGFSLVKKIRDIGAAYLQELRFSGDGPLDVVDDSAQRTVNILLARLEKLDFRGPLQHDSV
ncbi:uncharacterized protein B0I36DRAFT_266925 [Microdochium trichocladiopsis]|uniref:Zn(2)-C6 fungal-type domain-containing protein n=1 Tax=Microdochium trichocladiopsis TaxID=1682393 RepID=A0A9P8YA01_9PEZI|nr:uncharacterized protein B0I36DRAFT_266925 [Microdochium trichocladiopsis]KAH7033708.1 hypothetical protein B0I36DRAFT_266925 [Microdochium trichocladiopsis]